MYMLQKDGGKDIRRMDYQKRIYGANYQRTIIIIIIIIVFSSTKFATKQGAILIMTEFKVSSKYQSIKVSS